MYYVNATTVGKRKVGREYKYLKLPDAAASTAELRG